MLPVVAVSCGPPHPARVAKSVAVPIKDARDLQLVVMILLFALFSPNVQAAF
jgi:hypothetical protein